MEIDQRGAYVRSYWVEVSGIVLYLILLNSTLLDKLGDCHSVYYLLDLQWQDFENCKVICCT